MLRNDGEKAQNILTKFMSKICSYRMSHTVLIMRLCLLHTNVAYTKSFMKFYKIAKKSTPIGTRVNFSETKSTKGYILEPI